MVALQLLQSVKNNFFCSDEICLSFLKGGTQIISAFLKSRSVTEIMKLEVLFVRSFVDQSIVHNRTHYMYLCLYRYM